MEDTPPPLNFKKESAKTSDHFRCNGGISDYFDDECTRKVPPRLKDSDNDSDEDFEEEE